MKRSALKQILVPLPGDPLFMAAAVFRAWINTAIIIALSTWNNVSGSRLSQRFFFFGVGICVGSLTYWAMKLYPAIMKQLRSDDKKN